MTADSPQNHRSAEGRVTFCVAGTGTAVPFLLSHAPLRLKADRGSCAILGALVIFESRLTYTFRLACEATNVRLCARTRLWKRVASVPVSEIVGCVRDAFGRGHGRMCADLFVSVYVPVRPEVHVPPPRAREVL
jgi:hypothetical protein